MLQTFQTANRFGSLLVIGCLAVLSACSDNNAPTSNILDKTKTTAKQDTRPNILLIVADDLGYTDLGVFGGEIETPHLDTLINSGIMLTQFHTAATCSPTRSMLFSGTDNHQAGLGAMAEYIATVKPELAGLPGYEGHLNFRVASLANLMQDAGYETLMAGKWHLGATPDTIPSARGFDRSVALLEGGSHHLYSDERPKGPLEGTYLEDGDKVDLPTDFYSTKYFAEKMIDYIGGDTERDAPFFGYLSFTAPHWPLQAPKTSIAKYEGRYDEGYDVWFGRRLQRQKDLGLAPPDTIGQPLLPGQKNWSDLSDEEKRYEARRMEIYAAMIDDVDQYVGKVVAHLKAIGEYENTVIVFMSDNGAEAVEPSKLPQFKIAFGEFPQTAYDEMGSGNSFVSLGPNWARVSGGASRLFKTTNAQGGILVPASITYPNSGVSGERYNGFLSVMDLMPTFLSIAGHSHPGTEYNGQDVLTIQGKSFFPILTEETANIHGDDFVMGWELFGGKALRNGDWKIFYETSPGKAPGWRLYNLKEDPTELYDLSEEFPEKLAKMTAHWTEYVRKNGVYEDETEAFDALK